MPPRKRTYAPDQNRVALALADCLLCRSPHRIKLDTVIVNGIQNGDAERDIYRALLPVADALDPTLEVTPEALHAHLAHPMQAEIVGQGSVVRLPNGEILNASNVEKGLMFVIATAMRNIALAPEQVTVKDGLRAIELLKGIRGSGSELEGAINEIKKKLTDNPPPDIDLSTNPYAADPPSRR